MFFRPLRNTALLARLLATSALPAGLAGGLVLLSPAVLGSAQALTQDVVLDGVKLDFPAKAENKGSMLIKKISFEGTNLSKDEVAKLFNIATSPEEARALVARLTATKISIPEAVINFEETKDKDVNKGVVTLRDLVATKVDQGKAAKIVFGGADIAVKTGDVDSVKGNVGTYAIDDIDISSLLTALKAGDMGRAAVKYSKVSFTGLDLNIVDKETPAGSPGGNMIHIKAGAANGTANYDGDILRKAAVDLQSVSVEFPKASAAGKAVTAFGYDKIDVGMKASVSYDPALKKLVLEDYSLSGVGAGVLTFKGMFGSLDPVVFTGDKETRAKALMGADFSAMTLRFANAGLAEKALAFASASQKKAPDAVKGEISGMAKVALPSVLGPDVGKKVADAIAAFLAAPKNLTVDVKAKAGALKFMDLVNAAGPQDVLPKIDLTVTANQ